MITVAAGIIFLLNSLFFPRFAFAQVCSFPGDTDCDGTVTITDLATILSHFGQTYQGADVTGDGTVTIADLSVVLSNFGKVAPTSTPTRTPTLIPPSDTPTPVASTVPPTPTGTQAISGEWTQFAHDSAHTDFTMQSVNTPWRYKWQWNGAGPDGKKQSGHLSSPRLVQPITGGGRVYTIAGNSVFALSQTNGSVVWSKGLLGTLSATPVYDGEFLFVPSGNGTLYKLDAATGNTVSSFTASSALNLAPILVGDDVYVVSSGGILYKINKTTLAKQWEYAPGSSGATPPAFSPSQNLVVYVTQDLYVHAVNAGDGTRKWRVKPTVRSYSTKDTSNDYTEAENGWPVIAEQHGIVFIRYRLEWQTLWTWNPYPTTNAAIKSNLAAQPDQQVLFAMNLSNGSSAFIPAVGNGGAGDGGNLPMGPQPIVRTVSGQEVVYIIWRNGQTCAASWCDGREDAAMGEMVLDNTAASGYSAGDVQIGRAHV